MREAVIVEAVRTPVGRRNGALSGIRPDELAAMVLKELVNRTGIVPELIEDVVMGCVGQVGEQSDCIARQAILISGFPTSIPGYSIDRQCGSSQQAIHSAAQAIISGDADVVIAGGVESMSRVPMGSQRVGAEFSPQVKQMHPGFKTVEPSEAIAKKWGYSRQQLDEFSLQSHLKAIRAIDKGYFEREIMPIEVLLPDGSKTTVNRDEGPRRDTTLEKLAGLRPVFSEDGKITAGSSSQISDGAAALLLMSREKAEELGLRPRFRVLSRSVVGSNPVLMLTGPIPATTKVLAKAGLTINDIDVFEVNEAFAPIPLAWLDETGADPEKLNPNGGAIALGHPLGCSGARLMTSMMYELERTGGRYGLQTMCEGFGMANATIIERLD